MSEVKYPDWFKNHISQLKAMRAAQTKFFATKNKTALNEAKKLESQVDAFIKQCEEKGVIGENKAQQTNLFE